MKEPEALETHACTSFRQSARECVHIYEGKVNWVVLWTYLTVCCINISTMGQKQFDHVHVIVQGSMVQRSPSPAAQGFILGSHAGKDSRPLRQSGPYMVPGGNKYVAIDQGHAMIELLIVCENSINTSDSFAFTSAPCASRDCEVCRSPFCAAMCSGVISCMFTDMAT